MQDEKVCVGLDIGTSKVCAVVGTMNQFGKLEILGTGKAISEGVKESTINNIKKTIEAIEQAIEKAENSSNIDIQVVNIGISGKHISILSQHGSLTRKTTENEITLSDINQMTEDMYRIVVNPGNDIIHVIPQHYKVDNEKNIKDPIGMSGVRMEADFKLITAQNQAIKNIEKCVKNVGLEIESLILAPLASSLSVLSPEEKEAGVCLVDIGGGTTEIAIFQDKVLRYTAILPFGGNLITQDIKQGCGIMLDQAEQIKIKFGKALSDKVSDNEYVMVPGLRERPPKEVSLKDVAMIIEARLEEIIELVKYEIIRSGFSEKLAAGIVLTGGSAKIAFLRELFKLKTNRDVRIGYPNEYLGKTKDEAVKSPEYATAIGLLLAGFKPLDDRYDGRHEPIPQQRSTEKTSSRRDLFSAFIKGSMNLLLKDNFDDRNYS